MREIAISKFKATCLSVIEEVRRTGSPVRITRFGEPMADVLPPAVQKKKSRLGHGRDLCEIVGDIVAPTGIDDDWVERRAKRVGFTTITYK
jgi:prevent-host-death family protein